MKTLAGSLLALSSFALVAAGCAQDQSDDVATTEDAVLTCGGFHHGDPHRHIGHHHSRHHHHGGGGAMGGATGTGGRPHLTGTGGSSAGGSVGTGGSSAGGSVGAGGSSAGGSVGTGGSDVGGSTGAGGTGGMPDPRCADVNGIVSWWHADGDFDDAIGSNDGTSGGAVAFAAGEQNQAFSLNGMSGSDVSVADDPSLMMTNAFTLDAWINPTTLGGRIIDKATAFGNDGYLMDVVGQWLRIWVSGDSITSIDVLPVGVFTHVAAVYDGANMGVYINGVLQQEKQTTVTSVTPNALPLHIGQDSSGGSLFNGLIDEPRVFNRALTADEVALLFWQSGNCH